METRSISPDRLARLAGLLYLVIIVCAGFSQGYVRASVVVPGDAAATAANLQASAGLFRFGLATDLVAFLSDAAVAVLLYVLLLPVSRTASMLAAAFRLVAHPAIGSLNLLNHWAALRVLEDASSGAAFGGGAEAASLFFLVLHRHGYLLAGAFFGVSLLFLGWLIRRAPYLPAWLGVLLLIAGAGYLVESFGNFLGPGREALLAWFVAVPAAVAEIGLCLWLLVRGVDMRRWTGAGHPRQRELTP